MALITFVKVGFWLLSVYLIILMVRHGSSHAPDDRSVTDFVDVKNNA